MEQRIHQAKHGTSWSKKRLLPIESINTWLRVIILEMWMLGCICFLTKVYGPSAMMNHEKKPVCYTKTSPESFGEEKSNNSVGRRFVIVYQCLDIDNV